MKMEMELEIHINKKNDEISKIWRDGERYGDSDASALTKSHCYAYCEK